MCWIIGPTVCSRHHELAFYWGNLWNFEVAVYCSLGGRGWNEMRYRDLVAAGTGLRDNTANDAGFDPLTVETETWDHKMYYPGAQKMRIRLTGDRSSHRILGAQIVGHVSSEVSKRIDIFATAIYNELTVEDLSDMDLSYTPQLSSPWDPVQIAAQAWCRKG